MNLTTARAFELGALDATAQHQALTTRAVTPAELVESAILRIEALNPALNAVVFTAFEQAREAAKSVSLDDPPSPFSGVPCLLKESLDYPGWPTTYGCRAFGTQPPATHAYPYVQRLGAAGLIPLGKTNVPEFSLLPCTESRHFGAARNPWAPDRSTAGSSGGAAAAVACGMVPLAHAADGAGSIRMPAAHCGVIGFKPSRGQHVRARAPNAIEDLIVSNALIARSARDLRSALQLVGDQPLPAWAPRPLRIGLILPTLSGRQPHPDVRGAIEQTAADLEALGHHILPFSHWPLDGEALMRDELTIWSAVGADAAAFARDRLGTDDSDALETWTLGLADWSRRHPDHPPVMAIIDQARRQYDALFDGVDVLLTPVLPEPPWPIGLMDPMQPFDALLDRVFSRMAYTPIHNLAGAPSVSLPLSRSSNGLPIGSLLSARQGDDALLLGLMDQLDVAVAPVLTRTE